MGKINATTYRISQYIILLTIKKFYYIQQIRAFISAGLYYVTKKIHTFLIKIRICYSIKKESKNIVSLELER